MKYKWSSRSLDIINTTSKYHQLCAKQLIEKSAIDIYLEDWGGFRTPELQNYLFNKGWSNADGFNKLSNHQITDTEEKSLAIDFCAWFDGKKNYNLERLTYISMLYRTIWTVNSDAGIIPPNIHLHSGLLWSKDKNTVDGMGWDRPHHEIKTYKQISNIK